MAIQPFQQRCPGVRRPEGRPAKEPHGGQLARDPADRRHDQEGHERHSPGRPVAVPPGPGVQRAGLVPDPVQQRHGRVVSLRWILVHMVEEYARHNGHADLLRERIDGSTGD